MDNKNQAIPRFPALIRPNCEMDKETLSLLGMTWGGTLTLTNDLLNEATERAVQTPLARYATPLERQAGLLMCNSLETELEWIQYPELRSEVPGYVGLMCWKKRSSFFLTSQDVASFDALSSHFQALRNVACQRAGAILLLWLAAKLTPDTRLLPSFTEAVEFAAESPESRVGSLLELRPYSDTAVETLYGLCGEAMENSAQSAENLGCAVRAWVENAPSSKWLSHFQKEEEIDPFYVAARQGEAPVKAKVIIAESKSPVLTWTINGHKIPDTLIERISRHRGDTRSDATRLALKAFGRAIGNLAECGVHSA